MPNKSKVELERECARLRDVLERILRVASEPLPDAMAAARQLGVVQELASVALAEPAE